MKVDCCSFCLSFNSSHGGGSVIFLRNEGWIWIYFWYSV